MDLTSFEEVKLIYRNKKKAIDRPRIACADDAYIVLKSIWDHDQIEMVEESKALFLDRQLRLMSVADISKGGITGTVVDLRVVFGIALKRRANSIILSHNHPSGNLIPSNADLKLTKDFMAAGKILNIDVVDHLIITKDGYHSIVSEM